MALLKEAKIDNCRDSQVGCSIGQQYSTTVKSRILADVVSINICIEILA